MANTKSLTLESGSQHYLSASDSSSLSMTGSFTLECWVNFTSLPTLDTGMVFMGKWNGGGSYLFYQRNDGGGQNIRMLFTTAGSFQEANSKGVSWTPTLSTWYHVAVVYDSSVPSVKFYVNTSQQGATQTPADTSVYDSSLNFLIGAYNEGTPTDFLNAKIDDIRVWNTALTQAQLASNYQRELAGNETNLVAYWKLNSAYSDSTSNGNNLTPSGTPVFSTDVPFADSTSTSTTSTSSSTSTSTTSTSSSTTSTSSSTTQSITTSSSTSTTSTSTTSTSSSTSTTSTSTTIDLTFSVELI